MSSPTLILISLMMCAFGIFALSMALLSTFKRIDKLEKTIEGK